MGGGITRTFRPWTHTSDDSYIYQLSLVVATATVSFRCNLDSWLSSFPLCLCSPPYVCSRPFRPFRGTSTRKRRPSQAHHRSGIPLDGELRLDMGQRGEHGHARLGEGFELRRHNKENVRFGRCRLRHGTSSYMVRVRVLRI